MKKVDDKHTEILLAAQTGYLGNSKGSIIATAAQLYNNNSPLFILYVSNIRFSTSVHS